MICRSSVIIVIVAGPATAEFVHTSLVNPNSKTHLMTDERQPVSELDKIAAAKNEWHDKEFTLGDQTFQVLDLNYFDYVEFVSLVKPLVSIAAGALEMGSRDGELKIDFNPTNLDFDQLIKICGKELPRMAWLVCKQSHPKITDRDVAILARRPQRLVEIVLLQIMHNNMIQEFGNFFQRLTGMVTNLVPDMEKVSAPSEINSDSMTEEIPS